MNPLIAVCSPRDIEEVKIQIDKIMTGRFDVLWIKYFKGLKALNIAGKHILDNPEYTHLCLVLDDLLINKPSFDKLVDIISSDENENNNNYPVLSGVCNMSCISDHELNQTNIVFDKLPDPEVMSLSEIDKLWPTFDQLGSSDTPQKVLFAGFPCTFISRQVIEKMNGKFSQNSRGFCRDVEFCRFLKINKIPHYMVSSARFMHLKYKQGLNTEKLLVGIKKPYTNLIRKDGSGTINY